MDVNAILGRLHDSLRHLSEASDDNRPQRELEFEAAFDDAAGALKEAILEIGPEEWPAFFLGVERAGAALSSLKGLSAIPQQGQA